MATKKPQLNRWQRLLLKNKGRWMTSMEQALAISSVTVSKVRHEAVKFGGVLWLTRYRFPGLREYRPSVAR